MIYGVLLIAGTLVGAGLIAGGVVALLVILFASNNSELAVRIVTYSYYLLIGLFPLILWLAVYTWHDEGETKAAYGTLWRAILTTAQGAIIGGILGGGPFFLATLTYPVVIFTNYSIAEFGPLMRDIVVWSLLSITLIATVLAAFPIGMWGYYSKTRWNDE